MNKYIDSDDDGDNDDDDDDYYYYRNDDNFFPLPTQYERRRNARVSSQESSRDIWPCACAGLIYETTRRPG